VTDILGSDATESMPVPSALVFKLNPDAFIASKAKTAVGTPDSRTGQVKRPPGRPPGSKNKRENTSPVNPSQRMIGSRQPVTPSPDNDTDENKKLLLKQQKAARAEQYATYINVELNDKLFMLIAGMPNSPFKAEMFYKENRVPPSVKTNPAYSELGNAVAIPADVAGSWGKLLAELSFTDAGKGIAKATDNHMLTIAMAALTALYSTYRYSQQLKPLLDAIKVAQAKQVEGDSDIPGGEPTG